MPTFEWKFDLSNLITIVLVLFGMGAAYASMDSRLSALEQDRAELRTLRTELVATRIEVAALTTELRVMRRGH